MHQVTESPWVIFFFFLCWFLFCSAFFLLSLFACLFPVFLCSVSFSVFVILWHGIQKGNTLLKFSKGNALNESLKLNGVRCLLRDSFFFSLSSRWEFSYRDDKEAGTFFIFFIQRFNILKIEQTFGNHVLSGQLYGKLGDFISLSNGMRFFYIRKNFHGTSGVIDMLF